MSKRIKYASLLAAAIFSVAPIASLSNAVRPSVVKADSEAGATTLTYTLKRSPIVLQPGKSFLDLENINGSISKNIEVNYGRVYAIYTDESRAFVEKADGSIDYDTPVDESTLKPGTKGEYEAVIDIGGLALKKYTYQTFADSTGNLIWNTDSNPMGMVVKIPFVIAGHKKAATKTTVKKHTTKKKTVKKVVKKAKKTYYTVNVRRGHRVRTYTSRGRFTKRYVYGQRKYRFNSKKRIKGHGVCYKIYGKNQWVPSRYLRIR